MVFWAMAGGEVGVEGTGGGGGVSSGVSLVSERVGVLVVWLGMFLLGVSMG